MDKETSAEMKKENIKTEVAGDCAHENDRPEVPTPPTEDAPAGSGLKKCLICAKSFHSTWFLKRHERTHTGEKPYRCSQCEKQFTHQYNLKLHSRTHSGERPYGCTVCGKRFRSSSDLKRHTRVHTGEKPFTCTTCGNSFSQGSTLKLHASTHTLTNIMTAFLFVDCGAIEDVDITQEPE